ncbi:sialidase family protein [Boudabousia liubingyangii]|uniref:sialidase family protein n=1 Tax=Boudabousia liubingyangii TaxID=1921764 RepID=UPI00093FF31C|nr:sialidase family protein [Boudabousia liubingyangii]
MSDQTAARRIAEKQVIAAEGDLGYNCHRIPAMVRTPKHGWLLAAWDGRPFDRSDVPQPNSILLRTSKDQGNTWEAARVLHQGVREPEEQKVGYSDPSMIVDEEAGKIFIISVLCYDAGFFQSVPGDETTDDPQRQILHTIVVESEDDGETWSEPRKITSAVTKERSWKSRFATSGQGIQLRYGKHRGRLLTQFVVDVEGSGFHAYSVYSDDHGQTWQAGNLSEVGADENKVVELSDGRLLMNSRTARLDAGRLFAYSEDGGETWSNWEVRTDLIDPGNNAGFVRAYPFAPQGSAAAKVLLFSNAKMTRINDPIENTPWSTRRHNGHVRVSLDDGQTWDEGVQFHPGGMAYSTLTVVDEGLWGVFFEADEYQSMQFLLIDEGWLGLERPEVK